MGYNGKFRYRSKKLDELSLEELKNALKSLCGMAYPSSWSTDDILDIGVKIEDMIRQKETLIDVSKVEAKHSQPVVGDFRLYGDHLRDPTYQTSFVPENIYHSEPTESDIRMEMENARARRDAMIQASRNPLMVFIEDIWEWFKGTVVFRFFFECE